MKSCVIICAVVLAGCFAGSASARDISKSDLNRMGLGSMQLISDADGMAVKGRGAIVYGGSIATVGNAASVNVYAAGGNHSAQGGNVSVAASFSNFHLNLAIAAGASSAHSH